VADEGQGKSDNLILDELTDQLDRTFRLLRGDADEAADLAFARVRIDTTAEAGLLNELAERAPLEHPDRFTDAHRLAMHALEVLDRDGWRHPRLPRLGPLHAPAEWAVEFVAKYASGRTCRTSCATWPGSTPGVRASASPTARSGGCSPAPASRRRTTRVPSRSSRSG